MDKYLVAQEYQYQYQYQYHYHYYDYLCAAQAYDTVIMTHYDSL